MVEFSDHALELEATLYTAWQRDLLITTPCISGSISAACSCLIVFMILYDRRNKLTFLYQRLLLVMSLLDVIGSTNMALGGVMTPQALGRQNSHGNINTCQVQGFFFQLSVSSVLYNLALCIYYHLVICNEWPPSIIKKFHVERWMHVIAILYPISLGVVGLLLDSFNPILTLPAWCYFSEVPWDCNRMEDVECLRGQNYFYVQLAASILPVMMAVLGVIICVVRIWCKVRQRALFMDHKYSSDRFDINSQELPPPPPPMDAWRQSFNSKRPARQRSTTSLAATKNRERSRQAA